MMRAMTRATLPAEANVIAIIGAAVSGLKSVRSNFINKVSIFGAILLFARFPDGLVQTITPMTHEKFVFRRQKCISLAKDGAQRSGHLQHDQHKDHDPGE